MTSAVQAGVWKHQRVARGRFVELVDHDADTLIRGRRCPPTTAWPVLGELGARNQVAVVGHRQLGRIERNREVVDHCELGQFWLAETEVVAPTAVSTTGYVCGLKESHAAVDGVTITKDRSVRTDEGGRI